MEWEDIYTSFLFIIHLASVLYALYAFSHINPKYHRAWTFFVLSMCSMVVTRMMVMMRALEVIPWDAVEFVGMPFTTLFVIIFITRMKDR